MERYVNALNSINKEIKKLNDDKKKLMTEKKKLERALYENMKAKGIDNYKGYKKSKLQPQEKEKAIRKKKKDKERDAIRLMYEVGIPNPEEFWEEVKRSQKA